MERGKDAELRVVDWVGLVRGIGNRLAMLHVSHGQKSARLRILEIP